MPVPATGAGVFVGVVGPSGAGKDTLLRLARGALSSCSDVVFAKRVVTRPHDPWEEHAPTTPDAFAAAVADGAFVLWWRAHGHGYGLPVELERQVAEGRIVVANISRGVIGSARARFPRYRTVLVTAPHALLEARRKARQRGSDGDGAGSRLMREDAAVTLETGDLVITNDQAPEVAADRLVAYLTGLLPPSP